MNYTGKPLWYHKILLDMLPIITDLLEENDIKYWLDWGTLIGAVQIGKMIPWDFDIDIGIFHDDAAKLLALDVPYHKFEVDRNHKFARKIRFFTEEHGFDFHIDLDPWYVENGVAKVCFKPEYEHPLEALENLSEIEFEGKMYPCPNPPEEALAREYGADWKTNVKVSSGNVIYIKKYAPDNQDIINECKKYGSWGGIT
jgi:phosphorylcholine metabolism protein LicD